MLRLLAMASGSGAGFVPLPPSTDPLAPYLGASHVSGDEKLHLYASVEGTTWTQLAADVYNPSGEFVRDPTLITWLGTRYMFHTRGPTGGAFGTTTEFGIAKVVGDPTVAGHWFDVGSVSISGANRVWAPQPFIDGGLLRVYVSVSTDGGTSFTVYETHNSGSDLSTGWSTPAAIGIGTNYIDPFLLLDGSTYELWVKNETTKYIEVFTSSDPTSGFSILHSGDWAGWGSAKEDPGLVEYSAGHWRMYADSYLASHIVYAESTDNRATWSALSNVTEPYYMQGFGGLKGADWTAAYVAPPSTIGQSLTKQGVVITRGGSGSWKQARAESPGVFWSPEAEKWCAVYVGYTGAPGSETIASHGVATASVPSGPWTDYGSNPFFSASGSGADSTGVTGPFVWYEGGRYYLFYIGLTASGYEGGTKSMCLATSTDWVPGTNSGTWTRHGAIISPGGGGWRNTAIWHPNVVKRGTGDYLLFFNASQGTTERIGYATSSDLLTWTVDDVNSPVLSTGSGWESARVGDPFVYQVGSVWWTAYYGNDGSHSQDGLASASSFPTTWSKFGSNPVLVHGAGGSFDAQDAARPCILIVPGLRTYYHFYSTDDGASPHKVEIAVATETW